MQKLFWHLLAMLLARPVEVGRTRSEGETSRPDNDEGNLRQV